MPKKTKEKKYYRTVIPQILQILNLRHFYVSGKKYSNYKSFFKEGNLQINKVMQV
jgi:hypothetical protein